MTAAPRKRRTATAAEENILPSQPTTSAMAGLDLIYAFCNAFDQGRYSAATKFDNSTLAELARRLRLTLGPGTVSKFDPTHGPLTADDALQIVRVRGMKANAALYERIAMEVYRHIRKHATVGAAIAATADRFNRSVKVVEAAYYGSRFAPPTKADIDREVSKRMHWITTHASRSGWKIEDRDELEKSVRAEVSKDLLDTHEDRASRALAAFARGLWILRHRPR